MFKHKDLQMFGFVKNNVCNFHPLEIVGRGRETQLHVGKNLNYFIWCYIYRLIMKITQNLCRWKLQKEVRVDSEVEWAKGYSCLSTGQMASAYSGADILTLLVCWPPTTAKQREHCYNVHINPLTLKALS